MVRINRRLGFVAVAMLSSTAISSMASADTFRMQTGQVIHGRLINENEEPRKVYTVEVEPGIFVQLLPEQVKKHEPQRTEEAAYLKIAREIVDAAESHWKLSSWCKANSMSSVARGHMERTIELDPEHATARRALDYVHDGTKWVREEDRNRQRGMVRDGKSWVLPEDLMLRQAARKQKEAEVLATRELNRWIDEYQKGRNREQNLAAINNIAGNAYIAGIADRLSRATDPKRAADPFEIRKLLVDVLIRLNNPAAASVLVNTSISDPDATIRDACREYVVQFAKPIAFAKYMSLLLDKDNNLINIAGRGLGQIGDQNAMLPLIKSLQTISVTQQPANSGGINAGFSQDGGAGFSSGGKPTTRQELKQNAGVLEGLLALEPGVNFEYDSQRWLAWYADTHARTGLDLRRDP